MASTQACTSYHRTSVLCYSWSGGGIKHRLHLSKNPAHISHLHSLTLTTMPRKSSPKSSLPSSEDNASQVTINVKDDNLVNTAARLSISQNLLLGLPLQAAESLRSVDCRLPEKHNHPLEFSENNEQKGTAYEKYLERPENLEGVSYFEFLVRWNFATLNPSA
jgi:hypothetical protein